MGSPPATSDRSVLLVRPSTKMIELVAAQTSGGGSGRGDAVTRAQAIQLRGRVDKSSAAVKPPSEPSAHRASTAPTPNAGREVLRDGLRIPSSLDNQVAVNHLLLQQPNRMRAADLREAIARQQEEAEVAQARLDETSGAGLPVAEQLLRSLSSKLNAVMARLIDADMTASGQVTRDAFIGALPLLKVAAAKPRDMGRLFDSLDVTGLGVLDNAQLTRIAKRRASTGGFAAIGGSNPLSMTDPGQLDIALQPSDRSRQLKELIFTREVGSIDEYERQKEVKSIVSVGQPLLHTPVREATLRSREAHNDARARAERLTVRERKGAVRELERVLLFDEFAESVARSAPSFDLYLNNTWEKREGVLTQFQYGVRVAVLRSLLDRRISALSSSLARAGIGMGDREAVRQLVLSLARSGRGVSVTSQSEAAAGGGGSTAADQASASAGLSAVCIDSFAFPEPPKAGTEPRAEPIEVNEIMPFDGSRLFALRVARRYAQMGYAPAPLTSPGSFPPLEVARELRIGAPFESGRPLRTGVSEPLPTTWSLPSSMLVPPPPLRAPLSTDTTIADDEEYAPEDVPLPDGAEEEPAAQERPDVATAQEMAAWARAAVEVVGNGIPMPRKMAMVPLPPASLETDMHLQVMPRP